MKNYQKIIFCLFIFVCFIAHTPSSYAQDGGLSSIPSMEDSFILDDDFDIYAEDKPLIDDPYEKYNRFMFKVNNKVYTYLFSPLAKGYDFIFPKKVQKSFNNVVRLASTPKRFFNNIFQKKPKSAFIEFERFMINSTIGIGGLFDPAKSFFHLEQQTEDFGQTLATYGTDHGFYIVWPIIGPSTPRDSVGTLVDKVFSPFLWFSIYDVDPEDGFRAFSITKRVNNYAYNIRSTYDRITETAFDPYIAVQNAYVQHREKNINQ